MNSALDRLRKAALEKAIKGLLLVPLCRCDQCKSIRRVLKVWKDAKK